MITLINKKLANRKGFTLIELLVVLAVLAIIALIAIPNFLGIQEQSKVKSDINSCETIKKAIELAMISEPIPEDPNATYDATNGLKFGEAKYSQTVMQKYLEKTLTEYKPQSKNFSATFKLDANSNKIKCMYKVNGGTETELGK